MTGENESSLLPEETIDPRETGILVVSRRAFRRVGRTALLPSGFRAPSGQLPPIHINRFSDDTFENTTQPRPTVPVGGSESDPAQHSTADAPKSEAPLL